MFNVGQDQSQLLGLRNLWVWAGIWIKAVREHQEHSTALSTAASCASVCDGKGSWNFMILVGPFQLSIFYKEKVLAYGMENYPLGTALLRVTLPTTKHWSCCSVIQEVLSVYLFFPRVPVLIVYEKFYKCNHRKKSCSVTKFWQCKAMDILQLTLSVPFNF